MINGRIHIDTPAGIEFFDWVGSSIDAAFIQAKTAFPNWRRVEIVIEPLAGEGVLVDRKE